MKTLTDDDERHGTYAGHQAHRKQSIPVCDPCRDAYNRSRKQSRHRLANGVRSRVTLGPEAHRITCVVPQRHLAELTGITSQKLSGYSRTGPDTPVLLATRNKILAARPRWTAIGVQRRLRALSAVGYSAQMIADEFGTWCSTVSRVQRTLDPSYIRAEFAELVVEKYEQIDKSQQHVPCSSARARDRARANGWVPPFAWDDIDLDEAPPAVDDDDGSIDPLVVEAVLNGRAVRANNAERRAIVAAALESGQSLRKIAKATGWNPHRYTAEPEEEAA